MGRRILLGFIALIALATLVFLLGPRVPADTTVRFDPQAIGDDPDAYLAQREAAVDGIRPGLRKEIVWAEPERRARTPVALVYVHGFSASKGELRPLPDMVAEALGANLFYTRLAGHGRDGPAMAEATVNAWVNDLAEAMAIGRRIGERVVVIATSTGGSLVTWAAADDAGVMADTLGLVLVSPNFGPRAAGAGILTLPWGGAIAELVSGPERGFEPINPAQQALWTTRYPTRALLPMAATVALATAAPVEDVAIPALFVYAPDDQVVRPERTAAVAARWGGPVETVIVEDADDPTDHVLAGDAMSPSTTARLAERITAWIGGLAR